MSSPTNKARECPCGRYLHDERELKIGCHFSCIGMTREEIRDMTCCDPGGCGFGGNLHCTRLRGHDGMHSAERGTGFSAWPSNQRYWDQARQMWRDTSVWHAERNST